MASPNLGFTIFLYALLGFGGVLALRVLFDILNYRDLQRRLREEQRSREETESR